MDYDYQLVGGTLLGVFGIVAIANAMVERRSPLLGVTGVLLACGLIGWAWLVSGGAMSWRDIPDAVYSVIGRWN
ncbi:MAG: hypothetical protein GY952_00375 [Rhodobacteraceae bacterium]|nr:hypothetical protein [Paracoccaceae bacterium]